MQSTTTSSFQPITQPVFSFPGASFAPPTTTVSSATAPTPTVISTLPTTRTPSKLLAKEQTADLKLLRKEEKLAAKFDRKAAKEHTKVVKYAAKGKDATVTKHAVKESQLLSAAAVHHTNATDAAIHANAIQNIQEMPKIGSGTTVTTTTGVPAL